MPSIPGSNSFRSPAATFAIPAPVFEKSLVFEFETETVLGVNAKALVVLLDRAAIRREAYENLMVIDVMM
jgi:hypothetical protein